MPNALYTNRYRQYKKKTLHQEALNMMIKRIYLIFWICISISATLTGTELPERLVVQYWNHWYPFDHEGKYYTLETFEYVLEGEIYSLVKYQTLTKTLKNDSVYKSTKEHKVNIGFSQDLIKKLLSNLSTSSIPLYFSDSEKIEFVSQRNIRELRKLAYEVDNKWFFDDLDREDIQEIKNIVSADSVFDRFINDKIDYEYLEMITVDYCNQARLTFYYKTDSLIFDTKLENLIGQPFIKRNIDESDEYIFNSEINTGLKLILPQKSILSERLHLHYCKRKYLLWILDNY